MKKAGDLEIGDYVELTTTVPATVRNIVKKDNGEVWVQYDRADELGRTFIVPYRHGSQPAEDAQDQRT